MTSTYTWANPEQTLLTYEDTGFEGRTFIPTNISSSFYTDYLNWVALGNEAAPYIAPTIIDGIEDLTTAKEAASNFVRTTAYSKLQPTDWVVVREMETGVAASEEITTYRAAVRTTSAEKVTMIEASDSIEDLQTYLRSDEFAAWPTPPAN